MSESSVTASGRCIDAHLQGAKASAYFALIRPRQWTKNVFCLAGLVFAGKGGDTGWIGQTMLATAAFCAMSSCIYVLNDFCDREADRLHPIKKSRPLASGLVSSPAAILLAALCLAIALFLGAQASAGVVFVLAVYFVLNVAYTLSFKRMVIVDVMTIAFGFLLRILAGTEAVQSPASAWIVLCTFFLALFLGFGKRRAELNALRERATNTRKVLGAYSVAMLDRYLQICGTLAIATYALFTMSPSHDPGLIITCPFVVFGLFRYLHLVEHKGIGEAPELVFLHDRSIQLCVFFWFALCVSILYFGLRLNIQ